jgi:hypothetical protein
VFSVRYEINIYIQDRQCQQCNKYLKCHGNKTMRSFCIDALHVTVNNPLTAILCRRQQ